MDLSRYRRSVLRNTLHSLALAGLLAFLTAAGAAGCRRAASPEQVVETVVQEAQAGRLEAFLDHFARESQVRLGMFWALSVHYGYLRSYSLQHMSTLQVTATRREGERAEVDVTDGDREGTLFLIKEDGEWKIDLLENDGG